MIRFKRKDTLHETIEMLRHAVDVQSVILLKGFHNMSNDFTKLTAAIDDVAGKIVDVAQAIRNPEVNNNDQATIDAMATRLEAASAALLAATAAENAEDAGTPTPVVPAPVVLPVEGSVAEEATETPAFETTEDATAPAA